MESLTVKLYVHIIRYQWTSQKTFHNKVVFIICCIKYYEGIHRKKDYPYVGYGHKLLPGEHYSSNMSLTEADLLLRKDLKKFCGMFSSYGKDSLLLAALAYNVGPYRILGTKKKYPKSTLLKKIEADIRDFKADYVQFCRWKG